MRQKPGNSLSGNFGVGQERPIVTNLRIDTKNIVSHHPPNYQIPGDDIPVTTLN
ncbi:MAG TPA: hypothetical protein VKR53_06205 [Puia sp.]|nr:hypothetical protein [Puia sp.]